VSSGASTRFTQQSAAVVESTTASFRVCFDDARVTLHFFVRYGAEAPHRGERRIESRRAERARLRRRVSRDDSRSPSIVVPFRLPFVSTRVTNRPRRDVMNEPTPTNASSSSSSSVNAKRHSRARAGVTETKWSRPRFANARPRRSRRSRSMRASFCSRASYRSSRRSRWLFETFCRDSLDSWYAMRRRRRRRVREKPVGGPRPGVC